MTLKTRSLHRGVRVKLMASLNPSQVLGVWGANCNAQSLTLHASHNELLAECSASRHFKPGTGTHGDHSQTNMAALLEANERMWGSGE